MMRCNLIARNHAKTKPFGVASFNALYRVYTKGAKKRNHAFELSVDEFRQLTSGNCVYCGKAPKQKHTENGFNGYYIYNGIDRIDNSVGYCISNCVTACKQCNFMKGQMSNDEFLEGIKRVYEHQQFSR